MTTPRTLTKSRFKIGLECPTKLFYTNKKGEYADKSLDDPFLAELAKGGFQVGELAKLYYPGGTEVEALGYIDSLDETARLLAEGAETIFEAAVAYENFFIRIDVFRKRGNTIDVIEVKSKSAEGGSVSQFLAKSGRPNSDWSPYLYDVAFQKFVTEKAFPDCTVNAFLMVVDKIASCPATGLNQKFRVKTDERGRKYAEVTGEISEQDLSERILVEIDVSEICDQLTASPVSADPDQRPFDDYVEFLARRYEEDEKVVAQPGRKCKGCQFKASAEEKADGMKSGFEECWKDAYGWTDEDFEAQNVLDIGNLYYMKADKLFEERRTRISEVFEDDIAPKPSDKPGLSQSERQWLQVEKAQNGDSAAYIDRAGLAAEFSRFRFPLHFIDFETSQSAIPFIKGHRPYEPIAFQFSHHIVEEDGTVRHAGQWLEATPGMFPNFEFVRALKAELDSDEGTIFRFADHENTYLNHIWRQLSEWGGELDDRVELLEFIERISKSSGSVAGEWEGERNMVDLRKLVLAYYYDPSTKGSNSIKQVLPAVLAGSDYLAGKYSEPVYGDEISSLNFEPTAWYREENGGIADPYKMLPDIFTELSYDDLTVLEADEKLADGGAAMAAYAKLQYEDMPDAERQAIESALYRYCELDTLAMVMIYEAWREMIV